MIIHFRPNVPDLVQVMIEPMIMEDFIPTAPVWLQELYIDLTEDDCLVQVICEYEYRRAEIQIGPTILQRPLGVLREALIHEAVHCYTAQLESFCEDLIEALGREDDIIGQKFFSRTREVTVQDLTHLIMRLTGRVSSNFNAVIRDGNLQGAGENRLDSGARN